MDKNKIKTILNSNGKSPDDMPVSLKGFNWGAFLLTFIWGIPHKAWITLWAIPLIWFQLPLGLNWVLLLALQIYCGIKGNDWAYAVDYQKSEYEFKMKQIKWTIFAFALQFVIPVCFFTILILFAVKSPDNFTDFIQNAQCKIAADKISSKFRLINVTEKITEEELAKDFAKQFTTAQSEGNTVKFTVGQTKAGVNSELYYIRFIKTGNICTIENQNCRIESGYLFPPEIYEQTKECTFFYDNMKNFTPSKNTAENIKKGYNIFKYL